MGSFADKTAWLVGLVLMCVGLVAGLSLGSMVEDADAAQRTQLRTLWANLRSDGLTTSYKGRTGNRRTAEGIYTISFNRNVSTCARTATLVSNVARPIIVTAPGPDPRSIEVQTFTTDRMFSDQPFSLVVNW